MTDDETIAHWIELSRKYPKVDGGPGVLPITKIGEAYYFMARVLYDTARKGDACRYWRLAQRDLRHAEPNQPEAQHRDIAAGYLRSCPAALTPAAPRP